MLLAQRTFPRRREEAEPANLEHPSLSHDQKNIAEELIKLPIPKMIDTLRYGTRVDFTRAGYSSSHCYWREEFSRVNSTRIDVKLEEEIVPRVDWRGLSLARLALR